jgi:four helix bundle suffix protein
MNTSDLSDKSDPSDRLLPPHGGYEKLRSFQTAQLVYDGTVIFCDRFIEKRSRTHDQMVQAARSGVQNIAEGSLASATSKKTELTLTNVARASLGELILDYQDFLRQRGLRLWGKDSPEALAVRNRYRSLPSDLSDKSDLSDRSDPSDPPDPYKIHTASAEVAANALLSLANQASYLIRQQLRRLEEDFLRQGGFTERLYKARIQARANPSRRPGRPESSAPPNRFGKSDKTHRAAPSNRSDKSDLSDASDSSDPSDRKGPTP